MRRTRRNLFLNSRTRGTRKVGGSNPKEYVSLRSPYAPRNEIQINDSRVEAQSLRMLAHRRDVLPLAGARKLQRSSRWSVRSGHLGVAIEGGKRTSNSSSALTRTLSINTLVVQIFVLPQQFLSMPELFFNRHGQRRLSLIHYANFSSCPYYLSI